MANVDNKLFEKRKKELGFGSDCTILHPSTERRRAQLTESIERLLNNTDSRKKNSIKLYAVGEDEVKNQKYKIRDMKTGKEKTVTEDKLIN